jgi:nickel-dependent lactate racemase
VSAGRQSARQPPAPEVAQAVALRTAAWYGDRPFTLELPASWDVTTHWPETPPPLTDAQIAAALEHPTGQPPIRELARGRSRPVIVVDDLNRPTPVGRVMPVVLGHLRAAGIDAGQVTVVVASGTHAPASMDGIRAKVGPEAAAACRLRAHDAGSADVVALGRTSFGTPVLVDADVARADLVIGVGGVYPNQTAGFGGGSKLALGVLAYRSIASLHYRHKEAGWGTPAVAASFRRDLDEVARMIRLSSSIVLHVGAARDPVRIACGDPNAFYAAAVAFSRRLYEAPPPGDADVVIANAYPNDLSVTFVRTKGIGALDHARPAASRIALAALSEGIGFHGLFPLLDAPRFHRARGLLLRVAMLRHQPGDLAGKVARRLRRTLHARRARDTAPSRHPIWMHRPVEGGPPLPAQVAGFRFGPSWTGVLAAVAREQGGRENLRAVVYPCGPLQWVRAPARPEAMPRSAS